MNSLALLIWIVLIIWFKKCAHNLIIWASNLANTMLRVDNKHTCDRIVDASIKTIKYLDGSRGGWINPQISLWSRSINLRDLIQTFVGDGLITNFSWEQAAHDNYLNWRTFSFFNGWSWEFSIIIRIIVDLGWSN